MTQSTQQKNKMMKLTLEERVKKAVENTQHDNTPYTTKIDEQHDANFYSYSGLVEDVINELEDEGIENPTDAQIEEFVGQMI